MECRLTVGQRVVCIDDTCYNEMPIMYDEYYIGGLDGLKVGEQYTIRWVGMWQGIYVEPMVCVRLLEIVRNSMPMYGETPYQARRFKPLEEKKTDIGIFTKLLVPNKKVLEPTD